MPVRRNGVYAMIFNPKPIALLGEREAYCGYLCADKRMFFVIVMLVFPFFCLVIVFFYKLWIN